MTSNFSEDLPFIFCIENNVPSQPQLLKVFLERGWKEYKKDGENDDSESPASENTICNLWWKLQASSAFHYKQLTKWQFNNHTIRGNTIIWKDNLCQYLNCMKKKYGSLYEFSPDSYSLPSEFPKFVADFNGYACLGKKPIWIRKPTDCHRGQGISLFTRIDELVYDSKIVVQSYVDKPMLVGGYKFDLRLFVLVPSFRPLVVYMYREGWTRFCTEKYSLDDLDNPFAHISNISINEYGTNYSKNKDVIGIGCKWYFQRLRQYLRENCVNDWLLWQKIVTIVLLTLVSASADLPNSPNSFELYGFDVLVDSNLKPWLIEVNYNPRLNGLTAEEHRLTGPMLHVMFDLLGLPGGERIAAAAKWTTTDRSAEHHVNGSADGGGGANGGGDCGGAEGGGDCGGAEGGGAEVGGDDATRPNAFNSSARGNGRDWPVGSTNDWVRVYPFSGPAGRHQTNGRASCSDGDAPAVVEHVRRYLECCEQVAAGQCHDDDRLGDQLRRLFPTVSDVWLPPC